MALKTPKSWTKDGCHVVPDRLFKAGKTDKRGRKVQLVVPKDLLAEWLIMHYRADIPGAAFSERAKEHILLCLRLPTEIDKRLYMPAYFREQRQQWANVATSKLANWHIPPNSKERNVVLFAIVMTHNQNLGNLDKGYCAELEPHHYELLRFAEAHRREFGSMYEVQTVSWIK